MSGAAPTLRPALFVDRDGTIIVEREYLADPDGVELIPGAAAALRKFQQAGYAVIVVTNQSGIARGYFGESDYHRVDARFRDLLAAEGIAADGVYFCPHHPSVSACECRKPGTQLYRQAAADHAIDLDRSVYAGDRRSDVEPARSLGGRGFLLRTGYGAVHAEAYDGDVLDDLEALAERVLRVDTTDPRK